MTDTLPPDVKKPLPERFSPSRLADFKKCPKAFWFKTIEKIPTKPTAPQIKGTLVHAVLEHLFELPLGERTVGAAKSSVPQHWEKMQAEPQYVELIASMDKQAFLGEVYALVDNYFKMENPNVFNPAANEMWVRATIANQPLHGIIDRLDRVTMPDGEVRVYISDYKTGKLPKPAYRHDAFFAMRIYALLLNELGERAASLRLLYLKEGEKSAILTSDVDDNMLVETEKEIANILKEINNSWDTDTWPTKVGPLCNWCDYQALCPEFRNTDKAVRLNPW